MDKPVIFPEPKDIRRSDVFVTLGDGQGVVGIAAPAAGGELADAAVARIRRGIETVGGRVAEGEADIRFVLDEAATGFAGTNADQAYELTIANGRATISASAAPGLLWGAVTLAALIEKRNGVVGAEGLTIRDWPDRKWRGLFAESRWGQDLMSLQDWKDAVDYLVDMKYNVLTVGVYNCWPTQYHGQVSEWMMLKLDSHPELQSPQHIEYYSASDGEDKVLDYIPRMAEEDFFGELVAYGSSLGVMIRPHFNTPGHNSLIPRTIPELSALDAEGNPTGYGFCLTNPRTYEVMFEIIDEICQKYLLPNGSRSYHIAADEVYPLSGMHPDRLYERISPWCQCPTCSKFTEAELYVKYITAIVKRLKENGIEDIGMWHDQLVRGGSMNEELTANLEAAGVRDNIILEWWRYRSFFDTTMPELGFRRWVVPMTGYYYQMSYRGHLDNIFLATRLGHEEDAEGVESYGVFDPAFHRHFAAQSEWSWNHDGGGEIEDFLKKYARSLFGDNWQEGLEGLRIFGSLVDSPPTSGLISSLFRYNYDYGQTREQATARDNYPRPQLEHMAGTPSHMTANLLTGVIAEADRALDIFDKLPWKDESLQHIYAAELKRIKTMAASFNTAAGIIKAYRNLEAGAGPEEIQAAVETLASSDAALQTAVADMDELFEYIETHRESYQVPHMLREMTLLRSFLLELNDALADARNQAQAGDLTEVPELELMKITPIPWVG